MQKTSQKKEIVKFFSSESNNFFSDEIGFTSDMNCGATRKYNRVFSLAPESTVGGSGLSRQYVLTPESTTTANCLQTAKFPFFLIN
jgi:hypothetical protein